MIFIRKEFNMINWINEFVDKDGVRIGGNNVKLSVDNAKSASNSTMDPMFNPEDGDQLKNSAVQSTRQQGYRKFPYSLVPLPARAAGIARTVGDDESTSDYMEDEKESYRDKMRKKVEKSKKTLKHNPSHNIPEKKGNDSYRDKMIDKVTKERIKEASKAKMEEYVEDIVSKNFSKDVLNKIKSDGEIRRNGIPNIDVIEENPVLVRKVKNLIDIIEKNQASGEQKGIILNFLINNIGTVDIPNEYKQEMLKKLR